jgi:hypothetical protein
MFQFGRLEELQPSVLPAVQAPAAHTKAGRDLLIADTSLAERTDLFDVFLAELGRLTSASLAAGALLLARQLSTYIAKKSDRHSRQVAHDRGLHFQEKPSHLAPPFGTDRCAMKIGPCPQCPESDGWPSKRRPSRWANSCHVRRSKG